MCGHGQNLNFIEFHIMSLLGVGEWGCLTGF